MQSYSMAENTKLRLKKLTRFDERKKERFKWSTLPLTPKKYWRNSREKKPIRVEASILLCKQGRCYMCPYL